MTLLTIAIPTFNRVNWLKSLLPELLKQSKPYDEIEILVNDNNSPDQTGEYLNSLSKEFPQLRAEKNEVNVGGEKNFMICVEKAKGKYVWLFGDDEVLCEGAIEKIISTLNTYPASLIVVGYDQRQGYTESKFYPSLNKFIEDNNPKILIEMALITTNIFRKSIFNQTMAEKTKWTHNCHMFAIMDSLMKKGTIYLLTDEIFTVNNERAPTDQPLKLGRVKTIIYLLYLGQSHIKPLIYAIRYSLGVPYRMIINSERKNRYDTR